MITSNLKFIKFTYPKMLNNMADKITLKSISQSDRILLDLIHSAMNVGKDFRSFLGSVFNCQDVPSFDFRFCHMLHIVCSLQLIMAIPGSYLKHSIASWVLRLMNRLSITYFSLARKSLDYQSMYYNWMESLMELEVELPVNESFPLIDAGESSVLHVANKSLPIKNLMHFRISDSLKLLSAGFEKLLIAFNKLFLSSPEFDAPLFEIVNTDDVEYESYSGIQRSNSGSVKAMIQPGEWIKKLVYRIAALTRNNWESDPNRSWIYSTQIGYLNRDRTAVFKRGFY